MEDIFDQTVTFVHILQQLEAINVKKKKKEEEEKHV